MTSFGLTKKIIDAPPRKSQQRLDATFSNSFFGRLVDDAQAEEDERKNVNVWSDMEKCIFLDRFLHHPKDFRKISTFLANKSTKDCVKFYYDSKKTVPYKHALKEFLQRKKRRGDVVSWDATVQAALAVGAVITEGTGPEDPIRISLPPGDYTYRTRSFHPMQLSAFDGLDEAVSHARQDDGASSRHQGKRRRSNWFVLDAHEKRYLKHASGDDDHHHRGKGSKSSSSSAGKAAVEDSEEGEPGAGAGPPRKKARKGYAYVEVGEDAGRLSRPAARGCGRKGGRRRRRQLEAVEDEAPEVEGEGEGGPVRRARGVW